MTIIAPAKKESKHHSRLFCMCGYVIRPIIWELSSALSPPPGSNPDMTDCDVVGMPSVIFKCTPSIRRARSHFNPSQPVAQIHCILIETRLSSYLSDCNSTVIRSHHEYLTTDWWCSTRCDPHSDSVALPIATLPDMLSTKLAFSYQQDTHYTR